MPDFPPPSISDGPWRRRVRRVLWPMLRAWFRMVHGTAPAGFAHYPPGEVPAIVIANHLSLADGPLLAAFLSGDPTFVVDATVAARWWVGPLLWPARIIRIDPHQVFAVRFLIDMVRAGERLVVFPEGRVSVTGSLMKVLDGTGLVADRTGAAIVPVRVEGTQFSRLSYLKGKWRRRWFPPVSLTMLPPRALALDPAVHGRRRRQAAGIALQDMMTEAAWAATAIDRTLFSALLAAGRRHGARLAVLRDAEGASYSSRRLLRGACVLGRVLAARTQPGETVGLLLPNAAATALTFLALQAHARVPAPLNLTTGTEGLRAACRTAGIGRVISSRRFVARARLEKTVAAMAETVAFVWLEDLRGEIGIMARTRGLLDAIRARRLPGAQGAPDAPAAVLFTSGTEGVPKGVVLSHRNILANCGQAAAVLDFTAADLVFNAMPMFHAFGLTVGTLLPLLAGVPVFLYPTPLHYRVVPALLYATNATIAFATDTFLAGWARYAHPYDFRSLRYLLAGAEKLRETTRRDYADRFGVRVLEGYGATETSPVVAINTPLRNLAGSVGRFLPGIDWRIEPVEGIADAGRLWVRGPTVMLGYLRADRPGEVVPPPDGWYDTGDIAAADADGFLFIRDRARRFAKIGGEMVSLAVGEELAAAVWPQAAHAVVAVADPGKGERLVLATTAPGAEPGPLLRRAREQGILPIMAPRTVLVLPSLPRLGTGKPDYRAIQALAAADAEVTGAARRPVPRLPRPQG